MIYLNELVDIDTLDDLIAAGYISLRFHPEFPLGILNYTNKTQFDQFWCDETKLCRGLIYNILTHEIIARPFPKFFNYGQPGTAEIPLDAFVRVTDKADGSLGIIYPTGEGYAVATRGSFTSDQAIKATEMLSKMEFYPHPEITTLVEIVYPENRIVLDYGRDEKLILLGGVFIDSGNIVDVNQLARYLEWPDAIVEQFLYRNLAEALSAPPRENAEGLVIRANNNMVKVKQEDYIQLHRLVFGLNERTVWEHLCEYGNTDKLIESLPDEFKAWVENVEYDLLAQFRRIHSYTLWLMKLAPTDNRKEFALWANDKKEFRPYLFMLLDGKNIDKAIWKSLRPKGNNSMKSQSEDVA